MKKLENLKDIYKEYHNLFSKLSIECICHWKDDEREMEIEQQRIDKVRAKKEEIEEEYKQWKLDNGLLEQCVDWSNELFGFTQWIDEEPFYRDWGSDGEVYESMIESIQAIDENEVNRFIENARKALNSIGYTQEKDYYEVHEFITFVEIINKEMRYKEYVSCDLTFAVDILENRKLWIPYRFGFDKCIENVAKEVDWVFLSFYEEEWGESNWDDDFDEDDYYID